MLNSPINSLCPLDPALLLINSFYFPLIPPPLSFLPVPFPGGSYSKISLGISFTAFPHTFILFRLTNTFVRAETFQLNFNFVHLFLWSGELFIISARIFPFYSYFCSKIYTSYSQLQDFFQHYGVNDFVIHGSKSHDMGLLNETDLNITRSKEDNKFGSTGLVWYVLKR